jgi:hypothetical protein
LLYLTEYGKIGTGHTALCVGSFTEKVDYVLVPIKSSNWTYKDFNDQTCIVLQPTKRRSEFQMDVYDSNEHKLGQVNDYGTASDNDGYKVGDVGEDGTVIDGFGRKIGEVSEDGTITDNDGVKLGNVSEDGSVTDSNDRKVGNVSIAHNDDIYLAGGAALLLLLKPK